MGDYQSLPPTCVSDGAFTTGLTLGFFAAIVLCLVMLHVFRSK